MTDGSRSPISLRQVLWIAAGAAILTFLVAVGSWLFSPKSPRNPGVTGSSSMQETTIDKKTFAPEPPGPGRRAVREAKPPAAEPVQPAEPLPPAASSVSAPESPAEADDSVPPAAAVPAPVTSPGNAVANPLPYGVQVGAFSSRPNAIEVKHRLETSGYTASILDRGGVHKVVVTGFADRAAAEKALLDLRHKGFPKAFIVPVE